MMDIVKIALSQVGTTEIKGSEHNPEVMKYFHETGRKWVSNDETPWCDAAMDWCAMKAGLKYSPGLLARQWMEEGLEVRPQDVTEMAKEVAVLVIFWRIQKIGIYGHVGLVARKSDTSVWSLGGNQGSLGQFNITPYPINGAKMGVLGYRRFWE